MENSTSYNPLAPLTLKNSLAKISFCDRECFNVNNNKTKEQILKYVTAKFGIQVIDKIYVNLNPNMIRNISFHEHLITTFTNGNPYIFWLTVIDNTQWCILIDRKLKDGYSYPKIHVISYGFAEELFRQDTIFAGELVRDINRNWMFLISDLLVHKGILAKPKNVLTRFQLIYDILENSFTPNATSDICQIMVKRLFQYSDIRFIFDEFMPSLSYVCKGLVFYTMNNQFSNYAWVIPKEDQIMVKHNLDDEFYRLYPEYLQYKNIYNKQVMTMTSSTNIGGIGGHSVCQDHSKNDEPHNQLETVLFYIIKTDIPDIYNLYTNDDKLNKHSIAFIPNLKTSKFIYDFFKINDKSVDTVAKCKYHNYFNRWIPIDLFNNKDIKANTSTEIKKITSKLMAEYKGKILSTDEDGLVD